MAGRHEKYQRLLDYRKTLPPTPTAVAHPGDDTCAVAVLVAEARRADGSKVVS